MIIASRPLSPGDVVTISDPFCRLLDPQFWKTNCFNCYKRSDELKRCSNCQVFLYCSRGCQAKDWMGFHKHGECNVYREMTAKSVTSNAKLLKEDLRNGVQFALRLYFLLKAKPELKSKKFAVHGDMSRSFDDLKRITAEEDGEQMPTMQAFVDAVIIHLIPKFDRQLFVYCMERLSLKCFGHCFGVQSKCGTGLGNVMYIELSAFNHSCRFNASIVSNVERKSVRVMQPIDAGKWITIAFIDPIIPKPQRMLVLKDKYNLTCNCSLCQEGDPPSNQDILSEMSRIPGQIERLRSQILRTRNFALNRNIFLLHKRDVELFRQLNGHTYCPDLASKMYRLLESCIIIPNPDEQDIEFLKGFKDEVTKHWTVTMGSDHRFYGKVLQMVSALESKLKGIKPWEYNSNQIIHPMLM